MSDICKLRQNKGLGLYTGVCSNCSFYNKEDAICNIYEPIKEAESYRLLVKQKDQLLDQMAEALKGVTSKIESAFLNVMTGEYAAFKNAKKALDQYKAMKEGS